MKTNLTRRQVLYRIAALGGVVPLTKAMSILGVMTMPDDAIASISGSKNVNPDLGNGKKVAIIGAGLSGLTAAYELSRRGYECKIFEADKRAKGRTFTVRPDGSSDSWYQEIVDKVKQPIEECRFDEVDGRGSLYFEAGAGRIPSHHRTVLHYCKTFGVPLESYIFATRSNLVQSDSFNRGIPVQLRQFKHNLRGYLAEMLRTAKTERLDSTLSSEEQQNLLDDLSKVFGELDSDTGLYPENGASRAGYAVQPGAGEQPGEFFRPFAFADLLNAKDIWRDQLYNDMRYYWQTSLMQPVGGMDKVAEAFLDQQVGGGAQIRHLISLHSKVVRINVNTPSDKVTVIYQQVDTTGMSTSSIEESYEADFCISTIAPSLLAEIIKNVDATFQNALADGAAVTNVPAGKVAWQSDRFWESDSYYIYGGISWTSGFNTQIWYPSNGFHNRRGILTGAYVRGYQGAKFGSLIREERISRSLIGGIKLHPELAPNHRPLYHDISKAMTIAWQNMAFQAGGWFEEPKDEYQRANYRILLNGQAGRFFMAGDAMSYTPGWMEGAVAAGCMAAENVINNTRNI